MGAGSTSTAWARHVRAAAHVHIIMLQMVGQMPPEMTWNCSVDRTGRPPGTCNRDQHQQHRQRASRCPRSSLNARRWLCCSHCFCFAGGASCLLRALPAAELYVDGMPTMLSQGSNCALVESRHAYVTVCDLGLTLDPDVAGSATPQVAQSSPGAGRGFGQDHDAVLIQGKIDVWPVLPHPVLCSIPPSVDIRENIAPVCLHHSQVVSACLQAPVPAMLS
jgi:hypothetical protein